MIIEHLTASHFKGLPNREFSFGEGITLVVGPNRAGKSTLHQALLTALFGLGKAADGLPPEWKDVLPWGFTGQGSLLLQYWVSSGRFRLERTTGRAAAKLMQERNSEWETISTDAREVQKAVLNYLGVDSPSVFARTVSVAQGDLARLGQADRQQIGRALEEVLIGRSGATFQQALKYLDEKVRKPLRREGRERIFQKLDRYQADADAIRAQIGQAENREAQLEEARQTLRELATSLPAKKRRLEELSGDPQKGEGLGLLTKLAHKYHLEEEQQRLIGETKDLQDALNGIQECDQGIRELGQQLAGQDTLLDQDLERLEKQLRNLENAVLTAEGTVQGCDNRIQEAKKGLEEVNAWFDGHPGFRDNREAVAEAERALQEKANLHQQVEVAEANVTKSEGERLPPALPTWRVAAGIIFLLLPVVGGWLTRAWALSWFALGGVLLLLDCVRRGVQRWLALRNIQAQAKVARGVVDGFRQQFGNALERLRNALQTLRVSQDEAERLLQEYHELQNRGQLLTDQQQKEEGQKKQAEERRDQAACELRNFCQEFGLESAEQLRTQIAAVRKLREVEEKKATLLGDRTAGQIEDDLNEKSVKLRGVEGELKSPQYANFSPTTEEIERWRREAGQLAEEVPELEQERARAEGSLRTLEPRVRSQPSSQELRARLEWLEREIDRGNRTVQACHEAERLLREVQEEHRTTYLPDLERVTSGHLRRMTNGFYDAVNLASSWPDVTVVDPRNAAAAPHELSAGSRDQLYFAFRLAVADQLSGGEPLPVLLDEAFSYFDAEHRERALDILSDLAESGRQVIYFTVRPDVERRLRSRAMDRFKVEPMHLEGGGAT